MGQYPIGTGITLSAPFSVNGVLTDPTTVTFYVRDPLDDLATYIFGVDPEVDNPAVGVYELAIIPTIPGHYNWRAEGTGAVVAACEGDFDVLPSPTLDLDEVGVEFGPCSAWVDGGDVAECCADDAGTFTSLLDGAALTASQILFEQSGRLYAGRCEKTVRPCSTRSPCGQTLSRGHLVGWEGSWWSWWDDREYSRACGCRPLDRILLSGYPVTAITEVLIDGVVIDPDTYRLDERRYLTRVRDPAEPDVILRWPACQDLDLPDTEDGTFSVTYEYGTPPPLIGQEAAKQLACQIYLACTNSDQCQLPTGATRIVRNGLTIERQFFARDKITGSWRTGLTLVDAFLNAYAVDGVKRRPFVWSPESKRYARPVGS